MRKFSKVSYEQFVRDYEDNNVKEVYDNIIIPERATKNSAGYDFKSTIDITLNPNEIVKIPTGIRCQMESDDVLMIYVRSSIGFKYQTVLVNGTGIIDSDYFNADNEGHIFIKIRNDGSKPLIINRGNAICQGVFLKYGITDDDTADKDRVGGIGSSGK